MTGHSPFRHHPAHRPGPGTGPGRHAQAGRRLLPALALWFLAAALGLPAGAALGQTAPEQPSPPTAAAPQAGLRPQDWGPIRFPTPLSPFQRLRMVFFHQSPLLPRPESVTVTSTATWANLWVRDDGQLLMDAEAWLLNGFVEVTPRERWSVSLLLPLIFVTGGVMDGAIEGFHDAFGLGNMGREEFPRNDVRMEVQKADGNPVPIVDPDGDRLWVRAPVLSVRFALTERNAPVAVSAKASVDLPEVERESNIVRDAGRDWGLGLGIGARLGRHAAGLLSVAYLELREGSMPRHFRLRTTQWSTTVALTFALSPTAAVATQIAHETAAARDTGTGFDRATVNLSFGMKWLLEPGLVLEGALVEDLIVFDNNADFALHGGLAYTF